MVSMLQVPQEVLLPEPVVKTATGHHHTLFLTQSGNVWACGSNKRGQLGLGSKAGSHASTPQLLEALAGPDSCASAINMPFHHYRQLHICHNLESLFAAHLQSLLFHGSYGSMLSACAHGSLQMQCYYNTEHEECLLVQDQGITNLLSIFCHIVNAHCLQHCALLQKYCKPQ